MSSTELQIETILDALQHHVDTQGERTACTFLGAGDELESLTYKELLERARSIGHHLLAHVNPGDRALMMYPAGLDFIEAFLGCLYAGIIAVPAYPPKKNRNAERVLSIATDCDPAVLLCTGETERNVKENFSGFGQGAGIIKTEEIPIYQEFSLPDINKDQTAFLQYTSGSTRTPRGVMVTHENIVSNELSIQINFQHDQNDSAVSWLPMFHDMGLIGGILQPLFVGFSTTLMAPETFIREPDKWLKAISSNNAVFSGAPNFAYDHCVKKISDSQVNQFNLSSWRPFNGAEPVRASTLRNFDEKFRDSGLKENAFFPCYGMAEATLFIAGGPPFQESTILKLNPSALENHKVLESDTGYEIVSCGQVGPDLQVRIVNPDTCIECSSEDIGEIWVHGKSVAKGYWNAPTETENTFKAELAGDSRVWLRTGDLGFLKNGELFVTGRLKDLIILRGRNIYPQDIEKLVEETFSYLLPNRCAAFSVNDEETGTESLVVVAEGSREMARQFKSEHSIQNKEFSRKIDGQVNSLKQLISDIHDIQLSDIVFVYPGTFPVTSSGKVQRSRAKKLYLNNSFKTLYDYSGFIEPVNSDALNDNLVQIICNSLLEWAHDEKRRLPDLKNSTKFSSLGIDSVSSIEIGLRLEKKLKIRLEPDDFYQFNSIEKLASLIVLKNPNHTNSLLKAKYYEEYKETLTRFQEFKDQGHDYFSNEIEHQDDRYVSFNNQKMLMMASYSYLGFISHEEVNRSAVTAIGNYGTGSHGARLLAGTFDAHRQLEKEIAQFHESEDSIVYSSGFMTNLATISALVGNGDVVIGDELNHASIVDGCKFAGADFHTFPHNNMQELENLLQKYSGKKILVVVDAVYSMDGDIAPLPEIVILCDKYNALLMVDEAHSLGVLGENGKGILDHFKLPADSIDIKMGTLSKTIASCGGYVSGKKELIEFLRYKARGYVFSSSLPAPQVQAARKCLELMKTNPSLTRHLKNISKQFVSGLKELGFTITPTESAIVPVLFKTEKETLEAVAFCRARGLFVVPVFYPAVPMDKPRIRTTVMASFTEGDIEYALSVFKDLAESTCLRDV